MHSVLGDYIFTSEHVGSLFTLIVALAAYSRAWAAGEKPGADTPGLLVLYVAGVILHFGFVFGPLNGGSLSLRPYLLAVLLPSFGTVSIAIGLTLFRLRHYERGYRLVILGCGYFLVMVIGLFPVSTPLIFSFFLLLTIAWRSRLI